MKRSTVQNTLHGIAADRGAGFVVLMDPDRLAPDDVPDFCGRCEEAGVDALFVGSSVLLMDAFDEYVGLVKASSNLPVIGFPGSIHQLSKQLDAVLFLSVVSGRNAEYLIGGHVHAAPIIRARGIEPIATGYMLIESGRTTTAQYMSGSLPLPRHKPDVAAATALAAEMLGMSFLFADGGSGADDPVPCEIVSAITRTCEIPLIVGGGIRTPAQAEARVVAGASFVVVGNRFESPGGLTLMAELADSIHVATPRPV